MITMQEASKDLLLYATATAEMLENCSRQMSALGRPVFAHNFGQYASMFRESTALFFEAMMPYGYGVYLLPGVQVPSSFYRSGMSFRDYRGLMENHPETAADPNPVQTMMACLQYAEKTFNAAMDAAIRAAKDGERELLYAVAGQYCILHASALVWLWIEDAFAGQMRQLLLVPDCPQRQPYNNDLTGMEEVGDSGMVKHLAPEFIFLRMDESPTAFPGQRVEFPLYGAGRLVRCDSQDAADYIQDVVESWHSDLCAANGI